MDEAAENIEGLEIRRWKLSGWQGLHEPRREGGDWGVTLPNSHFVALFDSAFPELSNIGWRSTGGGAQATYLMGWDQDDIDSIREFFELLSSCVVIEDATDGSFALDFRAEQDDGDAWVRTEIGALVYAAKPYSGPATAASHSAASTLAQRMATFVTENPALDIDAIVAVPPSDPAAEYRLPSLLAEGIAAHLDVPFIPAAEKVCATPSIKTLPRTEKLEALSGSIRIDEDVKGMRVLLVDDLYQSGITLNYVAELLREAGASAVYGLATVKTMRNDDNLARDGGA